MVCSQCSYAILRSLFWGLTPSTESGLRARNNAGFLCSGGLSGGCVNTIPARGITQGCLSAAVKRPTKFDKAERGHKKMSTTIPLTYRVDHEIGRDAKEFTPIQIQEISAQQSIFYCRCMFYLIRQAAISEPHDPRFNHLMFLHVLEEITTIGEALSTAAHNHVENLASLKTNNARAT